MAKVVFQKEIPATPPSGTPIKVTETSDGDVQHVNVDTVPAYTPITQYVEADANNSSTTNLDSPTYTFTGTKTSTLGVAGIQVSLFADKNCRVWVEQSPEGTNWDLSDVFYYTASSNFGITVQTISSYVRVIVVTNNETTTKFRLQTALCPIVEAVPRTLDSNGNFRVATGIDSHGFSAENTPMGETRAVEPVRLVGAVFEGGTIDARFWTTAAAGTGAAIAQGNAQLLMTSGTGSTDTVTAFTVRRARYIGGASMRYRAVVQVSAGKANNVRRWGVAWGSAAMPTVTDGAWFMWSGTTFQVQTCKTGTPTTVSSFNGNLGPTYDPGTGAKTYEIYWTNSRVYFVIGGVVLHTVSASAATWADTMQFHAFMDSVNSNTIASSATLACRTATIYRLGKITSLPTSYYVSGSTAATILKYGAGSILGVNISNVSVNAIVALYDGTSTSGSTIWASGQMGANAVPFSVPFYGNPFFSGLTLYTGGAAVNAQVIYE